jgi:hypothetical protein
VALPDRNLIYQALAYLNPPETGSASHKVAGHKESSSHRLRADNQQVLTSFEDDYLQMPLYMGSSGEEMTVMVDISNDFTIIESDACSWCGGDNYDSDTSVVYEWGGLSSESITLGYSIFLYGSESTDQICLNSVTTCEDVSCDPTASPFVGETTSWERTYTASSGNTIYTKEETDEFYTKVRTVAVTDAETGVTTTTVTTTQFAD